MKRSLPLLFSLLLNGLVLSLPMVIDPEEEKLQIYLPDKIAEKEEEKKAQNRLVESNFINHEKPTVNAYRSEQDQRVEQETLSSLAIDKTDLNNLINKYKSEQNMSELLPAESTDLLAEKEEQKNSTELESNKLASRSVNDYLENIPLGELTLLNTQKEKHWSYFQRIKKEVEFYWNKKMFTLMPRIAARDVGQHLTSIKIKIDREGIIKSIVLLKKSKIISFNQAAIDAFNQAGPFPNPPTDLLKDNMATIEWNFIVKA